MASCPVCCDDYTKVLRKPVGCLYCKYDACNQCTRKYIVNTTKEPHCMNCNVGWNKEFMHQHFPKAFLTKDLREHRKQILIDREKSMLVASLPYAEEEVRQREINEKINEYQKKIGYLWTIIMDHEPDSNSKHHEKLREYQEEIGRLLESMDHKPDLKTKREFIKACPAEGCKGFLSTSWKCALCNSCVCPECHEIKEDNKNTTHTCNPQIVESVKMLKKDTRPCPTCASMIHKIDGCNQMWCTSCHTTFDWKTGKIESGAVHNPHYYEYLRKNGAIPRNIGDVPCGGLPTAARIAYVLRSILGTQNITDDVPPILEVLRLLQHIQNVEIPRRPIQVAGVQNNLDLRIQYILNNIDEETWKEKIFKRDKQHEKNHAHRLIFEMVVAVGIDLLNKVINAKTRDDLHLIYTEMLCLKDHTNKSLLEISKVYDRTVAIQISNEWYMTSIPI